MTTTTKKAPTADLLGQARSGLGMALLGVSAVVLWWVAGVVGAGWMPRPAQPASGDWFTATGEGTDTTVAFETLGDPLRVAWRATCPVNALVTEWDGRESGRSLSFAHGRRGSMTLPLPPGSYFFEVTAACEWTVTVNPVSPK